MTDAMAFLCLQNSIIILEPVHRYSFIGLSSNPPGEGRNDIFHV